jgi:hypothetical protein
VYLTPKGKVLPSGVTLIYGELVMCDARIRRTSRRTQSRCVEAVETKRACCRACNYVATHVNVAMEFVGSVKPRSAPTISNKRCFFAALRSVAIGTKRQTPSIEFTVGIGGIADMNGRVA